MTKRQKKTDMYVTYQMYLRIAANVRRKKQLKKGSPTIFQTIKKILQ